MIRLRTKKSRPCGAFYRVLLFAEQTTVEPHCLITGGLVLLPDVGFDGGFSQSVSTGVAPPTAL